MKTITAEHFVRQLKRHMEEHDARFVFFLGAGCSISSGIPGASRLVRGWLSTLHEEQTAGNIPFDKWLNVQFPDYNELNPAGSYAKVFKRLCHTPLLRQRAIEKIVTRKDPAFGYAVLAQLMTHSKFGQNCNRVLTTNFDDLVADALYLYTRTKPLVIIHDSLISFVEVSRARSLIVKLHGDALLEPKNLEDETSELGTEVAEVLAKILQESGLVFIGYGGNDQSISRFFSTLPPDALPLGVYWINDEVPDTAIGEWLENNNGSFWVPHLDFDSLMLLMRREFDLDHPEEKRFDALMEIYRETFKKLSHDVTELPEGDADKAALESAVADATGDFKDWNLFGIAAEMTKANDPDRADQIYQEGIKKFPNSAPLLGSYAVFLQSDRGDMDSAEICYQRALEADPNHANNLGNYALFLQTVRDDMDGAEAHFKRALEARPNHANNLGNYAVFLHDVRRDMECAETHYQRALEVDPDSANSLGNYALLLQTVRDDMDGAEVHYKRALEADPDNATNLGNYALFLKNTRDEMDDAEAFYRRALKADPNHANNLLIYGVFLEHVRDDMDGAEAHYKRALEADPSHANTLGTYALFLERVRDDMVSAETYYKRAIHADPNHANNLGNYALFLQRVGDDMDGADAYYKRAVEARDHGAHDPKTGSLIYANNLGNYALFLQRVRDDMDGAETYYKRAIEAAPNHANNISNYAGFLLSLGRSSVGFKRVDHALSIAGDNKVQMLECQFYRFAHGPDPDSRRAALAEVKGMIDGGVRSAGFSLSINVERAREDGHPEFDLVEQLAKVIIDEANASSLKVFPAWRGT